MHIYCWMIYSISAAYGDYRYFDRLRPGLLFVWTMVSLLVYVVIPACVLYQETLAITNDTSSSDSQQLLLDYSDEQAKRSGENDDHALDSARYHPPTLATGSTAAIDISEMEDIILGHSQGSYSDRTAGVGSSTSNPDSHRTRDMHINTAQRSGSPPSTLMLQHPHQLPHSYPHQQHQAFTPRSLPVLREEDARADGGSTEWASVYSEKRLAKERLDDDVDDDDDEDSGHAHSASMWQTGFGRSKSWLRRRRGQVIIRNQHRPKSTGVRSRPHRASNMVRQSSLMSGAASAQQQQDTATTFALVNAAADASMDPFRMLTTLRRLGVTSVDAKAMVSYVMRSKRRTKDSSLAMVV